MNDDLFEDLDAMKARLRRLEKKAQWLEQMVNQLDGIANRLDEMVAGHLAEQVERRPMSAQAAQVVSDAVAKAMEHYQTVTA